MKRIGTLPIALVVLSVTAAFAQERSNPEFQRVQEQYAKSIAQVQEETRTRILRINQQYSQSLDTLQQQLTRAGNLDAALAVRDEKKKVAESIAQSIAAGGEVSKQEGVAKLLPKTQELQYSATEGWRDTGIQVRKGDKLTITAKGTFSLTPVLLGRLGSALKRQKRVE